MSEVDSIQSNEPTPRPSPASPYGGAGWERGMREADSIRSNELAEKNQGRCEAQDTARGAADRDCRICSDTHAGQDARLAAAGRAFGQPKNVERIPVLPADRAADGAERMHGQNHARRIGQKAADADAGAVRAARPGVLHEDGFGAKGPARLVSDAATGLEERKVGIGLAEVPRPGPGTARGDGTGAPGGEIIGRPDTGNAGEDRAGTQAAMKKMEEGRRERGESREGRRPEAAGCRLQAPASSLQPLASTYFLPYQAAWITDGGHLKICEKGRQIGLSYADSYDSVRKAAVAKSGRDVWVMSRDEIQAKQYIRYCKRWAQVLRYAAEEHGEELFTTTAGKAIQAQALTFKSGANIYALSSNPDAIVGKTGHVKLDEFALHKDQRTLYAVAKPVIQWGGTLSIISTHRGAGTVFNELLRDVKERGNPMGWSHHCIPIQRAVEDGLVEKIAQASERGSVEASERGSSNAPTLPRSDAPTLRAAWLARQQAECIDQEQWL